MNRCLRVPVATQPCLARVWRKFSDTGVSALVIYPEAVGARTFVRSRASEETEGFRP